MSDGWVTQQDPESGAEYYYNVHTGQSSWTWPPEGYSPVPGGYSNEKGEYQMGEASIGRGPRSFQPKIGQGNEQSPGCSESSTEIFSTGMGEARG